MCEDTQACAFHAARDPGELTNAFFLALRRSGSRAFVDFLTWLLSNVERGIPDAVLDNLAELSMDDVREEFAELLDQEDFDTQDLRRLSAVTLAAAMMTERQDDDAPNDPPKKRPTDHRSRKHR